jgi:uncharacterized protein YndB with AHSA1/START domain
MAVAGPKPAEGWAVVNVKRTFKASPDRVFDAWLDPELLRQWLTGSRGTSPSAEVDPTVGGEFRIAMTSGVGKLYSLLPGQTGVVHMVGRYVEIDRPKRLVFTVGWEDFPTIRLDPESTTVTVEFHELEEGTEVVLTHERNPSRRISAFHRYGWKGSLRKLDGLLERST